MLYQLFTWLKQEFNLPGAGMFQFLTFRIAMAVLLSLVIATVFGKKLIEFLQNGFPLEPTVYVLFYNLLYYHPLHI